MSSEGRKRKYYNDSSKREESLWTERNEKN
jgi:hypothetical protein